MINDIINIIQTTALKHIAVKSFKYQKRIMINQQGNNRYFQVILEDNMYMSNINEGKFKCTANIDILGFPHKDGKTIISHIQDTAFSIAVALIWYINSNNQYQNIININNYDILTLSNFTDDNAAGVRLTLDLILPNPLNICTVYDDFDEDNMEVEDTDEIIVIPPYDETNINNLNIHPIKLK